MHGAEAKCTARNRKASAIAYRLAEKITQSPGTHAQQRVLEVRSIRKTAPSPFAVSIEKHCAAGIPAWRQLRQQDGQIACCLLLVQWLAWRNGTYRVTVDNEYLVTAAQKIPEVEIFLRKTCGMHRTEQPEGRAQHIKRSFAAGRQRRHRLPEFFQASRMFKIGGKQNVAARLKSIGQQRIGRQYASVMQRIDSGSFFRPMPGAAARDEKLDQYVPAVPVAFADNSLAGQNAQQAMHDHFTAIVQRYGKRNFRLAPRATQVSGFDPFR